MEQKSLNEIVEPNEIVEAQQYLESININTSCLSNDDMTFLRELVMQIQDNAMEQHMQMGNHFNFLLLFDSRVLDIDGEENKILKLLEDYPGVISAIKTNIGGNRVKFNFSFEYRNLELSNYLEDNPVSNSFRDIMGEGGK